METVRSSSLFLSVMTSQSSFPLKSQTRLSSTLPSLMSGLDSSSTTQPSSRPASLAALSPRSFNSLLTTRSLAWPSLTCLASSEGVEACDAPE